MCILWLFYDLISACPIYTVYVVPIVLIKEKGTDMKKNEESANPMHIVKQIKYRE